MVRYLVSSVFENHMEFFYFGLVLLKFLISRLVQFEIWLVRLVQFRFWCGWL